MSKATLGMAVLAVWSIVLGLEVPGQAATVNLGEVCSPETVLSLVGVDTTAGTALFRIREPSLDPPVWLLEVGADGSQVELYPEWSSARRFSGSTGPGPVMVLERCGPECARAMRWSSGSWQPLGTPLVVAQTETVHLTWDNAGVPWVVLHEATGQPGRVRAAAFRGTASLNDGLDEELIWDPRGALVVRSVGSPALLPDPASEDAVLSGTGRFRGSGDPEGWLEGLPAIPDDRRGQVMPLGVDGAFYLAGDGAVYLSADAGRSWRSLIWTPWTTGPTEARIWQRGIDFSLDRPVGSPDGALELVWFDDRLPGDEKVVLTVGDVVSWQAVATVSPNLDLGDAEFPLEHILRLGTAWLLVGGCASPTEGAGVVLRIVEGDVVSPPRLAPFVPSWLGD